MKGRKRIHASPPERLFALSLRVHGVVLQVWHFGSRKVALGRAALLSLRVHGVELQVWYIGVPDCARGYECFRRARDRAHSVHRIRRLKT